VEIPLNQAVNCGGRKVVFRISCQKGSEFLPLQHTCPPRRANVVVLTQKSYKQKCKMSYDSAKIHISNKTPFESHVKKTDCHQKNRSSTTAIILYPFQMTPLFFLDAKNPSMFWIPNMFFS